MTGQDRQWKEKFKGVQIMSLAGGALRWWSSMTTAGKPWYILVRGRRAEGIGGGGGGGGGGARKESTLADDPSIPPDV